MLALEDRATDCRQGAKTEIRTDGWAPGPRAAFSHLREGDDNAPLLALADNALGDRFRSWRGASGRRYVFSIYDPPSCPAYNHAVIIVAAVSRAGDRTALFVADSGWFPEMVVGRAIADWTRAGVAIEFHVHLLTNSPAERSAVIADLSQAPRS